MTSVWVFPGQGSQYKGMGAELFDRYPRLVRQADDVLGYSIRKLCLEDPNNVLGQTQFTQPALFVTTALAYLQRREQSAATIEYFAGHSLGEFNALFAAGAFDFETGVALVHKRGQLMAQAPRGAMAAVLGLDERKVRGLLADSRCTGIDIANINSRTQIVLSGPHEEIQKCEPLFVNAGARYARLNVSAAFHSRFMRGVEEEFAAYVARVPLGTLSTDVIANCTARPYPRSGYQDLLTRQIQHPVKWYESISWVLAQGNVSLEEVGPGDVLTKLYFKIKEEPMSMSEPKALSRRTVFMYSGQGSQYYLMGKELYEHNTVFRDSMRACDALYGSLTGKSMLADLYHDAKKNDEMTDVMLSHPALLSVGYSLTQVLLDKNIQPDSVLGYSLGEYVAATVAGVLSLEDAMSMVVQQAKMLRERARGGGMLTVLTSVDHYERNPNLYAGSTLASVNFNQNFVVSGQSETLSTLNQRLDGLEIASAPLPVLHAFHSPAMDPLETEFRRYIERVEKRAPQVRMYSCARKQAMERCDVQFFWDVVRSRVDFYKLVSLMSEQTSCVFVDLGPTGTLSSFIKHGFGNRIRHAASINQFGRNLQTLNKLIKELSEEPAEAVS